jgi:hypothetical protein
VLADVHGWTDTPRSGVSMIKEPSGETRPGTRWRESVRLGPGPALAVHSVVTEAEPGRTLAMTFTAPRLTGSLWYTPVRRLADVRDLGEDLPVPASTSTSTL